MKLDRLKQSEERLAREIENEDELALALESTREVIKDVTKEIDLWNELVKRLETKCFGS